MARKREEQLRLEGGARTVGVKVAEKRVLRFVEHHGRIETRSESIGKQGFSDAGRPFDGDVAEVQG